MKKKDLAITIAVIVVIAAVAFVLSRRSKGLPLTPSSPFSTATSTSEKPAEGSGSDTVVMRVNGEPITEREFNVVSQGAPAGSRRQIADELVKLKALQQEGAKMNVGDDQTVQTQIEMARAQIIAGKTLEKLVEKRSEDMLQKAFAEQKTKAMVLRHIAIAYAGGQIPPRDPNARLTADQAMAKAQAIVRQLRGGVDFGATAAASSDDMQTAPKGGMIGPVQPEQLPPNIAAVVKAMKPGQISEPLKTEFAVHVFKTEEPTLEDMRPALSQQVKQQAAKEEIDRLQKAAKVDLDPKFFPPEAPPMSPTQIPAQPGAQKRPE